MTSENPLNDSRRLGEPKFAGLIERYLGSEKALKAADGDLYTVGQPNEHFSKCAFVLTPRRMWAFRAAGIFGPKKPAMAELIDIEKIAITQMSALGKADEVGVTFRTGAKTHKGGPEKFTVSLVARWQMKIANCEDWAAAIRQAGGPEV